ncbi:MAG: SGNH hydrolase domain-containing protein [Roseateles sp.]
MFARHLLLGHPGPVQAGVAVLLAVALAWASLRWVETPVRQSAWPQRRMLWAGAAAIGACLLLAAGLWGAGHRAREAATPANTLLAAAGDANPARERCHVSRQLQLGYADRCQFGPAQAPRQLAVWGDSHGVEIAAALAGQPGAGRSLAMLTASGCPPTDGFSPPNLPYCAPHNEAVLKALAADARVDRVLLASRTSGYLGDAAKAADYEQGLRRAAQALVDAGKQVWLLDPVPTYGYAVPAALAQRQRRGQDLAGFGMAQRDYLRREAAALALLERVAAATGARRIAVGQALCGTGHCEVIDAAGRPLYFDDNHLSLAGARLLADRALRPLVAPSGG